MSSYIPLSGRAAEMIAGAAAKHPDAQQRLLEAAEQGLVPLQDACLQVRREGETDLQRARRLHGMRRLRLYPDEEGMLGGVFRLTPEVGSQVKTVIEDLAQRFYRNRPRNTDDGDGVVETKDHFQADALAHLILRHQDAAETDTDASTDADTGAGVQSTETSRAVSETQQSSAHQRENATAVVPGLPGLGMFDLSTLNAKSTVTNVFISLESLRRGDTLPGERCDIPGVGPVNAQWVRALLGETFVKLIITDGNDVRNVTHIGRRFSAELYTALLAGDRECSNAGCHKRGYLEIDHIIEVSRRGPTELANLEYLCYAHHREKTQRYNKGKSYKRKPTAKPATEGAPKPKPKRQRATAKPRNKPPPRE